MIVSQLLNLVTIMQRRTNVFQNNGHGLFH